MKKINYQMIVSDFDHTLVRNDGNISQENKNAINKYIQAGGVFVISTGRMHYGILPRVKELGLQGLVACAQGTIIQEIESGERLLDATLPCELTAQICEKMEELGLHIHVYGNDDYYCNKNDEPLKMYESVVRKKAVLVLDRPLSQFVREKGMRAYKVLAMVHPNENQKTREILSNCNFEGCTVTKSADFLVEVIDKNYSKGTAVEFLAKKFNIPLKKTVAVGDQLNDIPMIRKAGLGLAVKNADEELKKHAIVLDETNDEDAIAKLIDKYGFTEK